RNWSWNDPVSSLYRTLFSPTVVIDPPMDRESLEKDLKRRTEASIPPGYKDAGKSDGGAGDLLIWYTILHIGKEQKTDLMFVSGEEKADWWHRGAGRELYPRFELVEEYHRASDGKSFHIASFSRFLELYGAAEQVITEVREEERSRAQLE